MLKDLILNFEGVLEQKPKILIVKLIYFINEFSFNFIMFHFFRFFVALSQFKLIN